MSIMSGGGDEYNQSAKRVVRHISGITTPFVAGYTILIALGLLPGGQYIVDSTLVILFSLFWVVLSLYFYIRPSTSRVASAAKLTVFHLMTMGVLVLALGFWQPFIVLYIFLFLGSYLYFGKRGMLLSILSLVIAGCGAILLRAPVEATIIYETLLPILTTILLGVAIVSVLNAQETKQQALRHSRERERLQYDRVLTIMNNLTDAAFTTDATGKILMYNAACLDLLDTNESLKGKYVSELFSLTDSTQSKVALYDVLKDTVRATRREDLNHSFRDGESIRLEMTFAPIKSGYSLRKKSQDLGGYIIIARDITKQKSLEEERDEFISVVSHELRTPITIVEGTLSNLGVLMDKPGLPEKTLLANNISTAHDQVLYLAKMVNDLSTLSRAERGVADEPEEIDVHELASQLFHKYEHEASARGLRLDIDLGTNLGKVNASRLYLEELLQNFVTNAIKYTHDGSITIVVKKQNGTVRFAVKDTGIGISRSDQNKIFNKFYRSEDYRIRETSGTGLGLYVSSKLARKLGTSLELSSRLNHGSTFSFELPAQ
jgi:PAS domain S-box-containing protein